MVIEMYKPQNPCKICYESQAIAKCNGCKTMICGRCSHLHSGRCIEEHERERKRSRM